LDGTATPSARLVVVDDRRLVVAAHEGALQGLVNTGVDLLVRHVGDEIAGPALTTNSSFSRAVDLAA
jgi:hypothetical protein